VTGFLATIVRVMRSIIADLTPASGRQDHPALPTRNTLLVGQRPRVHRIPLPTLLTIAKRPSWRKRDGVQHTQIRISVKKNFV
jgi:hypothetical protein